MTDIKEVANDLGRAIRLTKENACKQDPENCELFTYMHVMRAGSERADVVLIGTERDNSLRALGIAAQGMAADYISFTSEGWHAKVMENPDTGQRWGPGEMEQYVSRHGKEGVIGESLTTVVVDRNSEIAWVVQHFEQKGTTIEWQDSDLISEKLPELGGHIPDTLREIMKQPTIMEIIPPELAEDVRKEFDDERRLFHMDMAVLKAIAEQQLIYGAMLQAEQGSLRQQLIHERFGEDGSLM